MSSTQNESRISKLVRGLPRHENEENFSKTCSQIEELLDISENRKYVIRSFNCLMKPWEATFKFLPTVRWTQLGIEKFAQMMAKVTNCMESQSNSLRIFQWMLELLEKRGGSGSRNSDLIATVRDVTLQMIPLLNPKSVSALTAAVHEILVREHVETYEAFKVLCLIFATGIVRDSGLKSPILQDFIDVVIGWMVDEEQQENTYLFCADILHRLEPLFLNEIPFISNLLTQILDDMEDALQSYQITNNIVKLTRFSLLAKAYATVTPPNCFSFDTTFQETSIERFMESIVKAVSISCGSQNVALKNNKCAIIKYTIEFVCHANICDGKSLRIFIKELLLQCLKDLEKRKCSTLLLMDLCTALPSWIETVTSQPSLDNDAMEIFDLIMNLIDCVYFLELGDPMLKIQCVHSLLRTRNVSVLQKVYTWLVKKCMLSPSEPFINPNKETIMFVLTCLMDVANNRLNSILTRWALDPAIFDLLVQLYKNIDDSTMKFSILHILKSHCFAHSHFVSSVASKTFSAESTGSRLIPELMSFWIDLIEQEESSISIWILEWISGFIKTSASYSSLLVEFYNDFYIRLFNSVQCKPHLLGVFANILHVIVTEPSYENTVFYSLARDTCLNILVKSKDMQDTKEKFLKVVDNLKENVIAECGFEDVLLPSNVPNNNNTISVPPIPAGKYPSPLLCSNFDSSTILMSNHEFNMFILALISFEPQCRQAIDWQSVSYNTKSVKDAIGLLIRSKLKTFLGKPTEFFGQLQIMFKKYRNSKLGHEIPRWKLEFVYELDKLLNLIIHESLLKHPDIPEALHSFYQTNKHPCIEWLKRLKTDVIEVALQAKSHELAFLFASLSNEDAKVKRALFVLKDADTLKSMNELALHHFLVGNFEESLKLFEQVGKAKSESGENQGNQIKEVITSRITEILSNTATTALNEWTDINELVTTKDLTLLQPTVPTIATKVSSEMSICNLSENFLRMNKSSYLVLVNADNDLSLSSILKLSDWIKTEKNISKKIEEEVELLKVTKLLELGNLNYAKTWLSKRNIMPHSENLSDFTHTPLEVVIVTANLLYMDGELKKSASLYSSTFDELYATRRDESDNSKLNFVLQFAQKLQVNSFCEIALSSQIASSLSSFGNEDHFGALQQVYDMALSIEVVNEDVWFSYGNFLYNTQNENKNDGKTRKGDKASAEDLNPTILDCYTKYLNYYGSKLLNSSHKFVPFSTLRTEENPKLILAMIRILKLFKEGNNVDLQQAFVREEWLKILPDLAPIKKLQAHLFKRFPHQVAFSLAATESSSGINHIRKRIIGRKGVFESNCYAFTDVDERFHVADSSDVTLKFDENFSHEDFIEPSDSTYEPVTLPNEIINVFRELQRIGSSRQEQWVAAYQRIHPDWIRRITALRKDMARDSNAQLIQTYIQPVVIYYDKLWEESLKCETKADLKFVSQYRLRIKNILRGFRLCQSVEDAVNNYRHLSELMTDFDFIEHYKVSLSALSPLLSKFNFRSSTFPITLPGLPSHVSIRQVDTTVTILATKTKPKRLNFRGSDGKSYAYLVKGNENLNIDAGVMEFMKITDHIIDWPTRNYSVTPLGKRGGLIQIVNNTMPLFQLYKKFLVKNHAIERTTDLFWSRLRALGHEDRNPAAVKQVFDELLKETPDDLLSKELQLLCTDPKSWYNSTTTFTKDCALGSAIGYILGIGDRHLDNILVDIKNGHFIHVDFSVVFGKGANLRIPEKVPFRLTQNICRALKYPRATGSFRVLFENYVLRFQELKELALFAVNNIAVASQVGEDFPIQPNLILEAELTATANILRHRLSCFMPTISIMKRDTKTLWKKWFKTKEELAKAGEKLTTCRSYLENLTIAISILQEMQPDPEKLKEMREKCNYVKFKQEIFENLNKFREKISYMASEYESCVRSRNQLDLESKRVLSSLPSLENSLTTSSFTAVKKASELASLVLPTAWLSMRHPINHHTIWKVYESMEEVCEDNLVVKPIRSGHTNESVVLAWALLKTDVDRTGEQISKLQNILETQGIVDIGNEIQKFQQQCTNTEETLLRFTNASSHSSSSSDIDMFLQFSIPFLQEALMASPVPYDFIMKLLFLSQNALQRQIPVSSPNVLETLINLHLKARKSLAKFVEGNFEEIKLVGIEVVKVVCSFLQGLSEGPDNNSAFTEENVFYQWEKALVELEISFMNYNSFIQEGNTTVFDITSDLLTALLIPITNFTLPLTQECQAAIIQNGKRLLEMYPHYVESSPNNSDPLLVLLNELKSLTTKTRFFQDIQDGLTGSAAALSWLREEKDRFEWAYMNLLPKNEFLMQKRSTVLKQSQDILKSLGKWLESDEAASVLNKVPPGNTYAAIIQSDNLQTVIEFVKKVHAFSSGLMAFESIRFSTRHLQDHAEMFKRLKSLVQRKLQLKVTNVTLIEQIFIKHSEGEKLVMSSNEDQIWARNVEKSLSLEMKQELTQSFVLSDEIRTCSKRKQLLLPDIIKKLQRWQRILANFHYGILFIYKYAKSTQSIRMFKHAVEADWKPITGFWSSSTESFEELVEQQSDLPVALELTDQILHALVDSLHDCTMEVNEYAVIDSSSENSANKCLVDGLIKFSQDRIETFSPKISAERLIAEATKQEFLSMMYEGWCSWF